MHNAKRGVVSFVSVIVLWLFVGHYVCWYPTADMDSCNLSHLTSEMT